MRRPRQTVTLAEGGWGAAAAASTPWAARAFWRRALGIGVVAVAAAAVVGNSAEYGGPETEMQYLGWLGYLQPSNFVGETLEVTK